jgi:hypothetical protein
MAIDGTVIDVPDTDVNAAEFGYHSPGTATQSAFPQVRIVNLVECGTHASVWAEFDGVKTSERVLTERMAAAFTDDMIVLADRGLYSYHLWTTAMDGGAQLVWRISKTVDLPVLEQYRDGSFRSELLPSKMKAAIKTSRATPSSTTRGMPYVALVAAKKSPFSRARKPIICVTACLRVIIIRRPIITVASAIARVERVIRVDSSVTGAIR